MADVGGVGNIVAGSTRSMFNVLPACGKCTHEVQLELECLRQVRLLVADVGGVEHIVAAMRAHQHQEHVQCAGCLALVRAALHALACAHSSCGSYSLYRRSSLN